MPLVLLHGGAFDRADLSWDSVIDPLAAGRRVISPDLPGYGGTDGFGRAHDLDDLGAWLIDFLDTLELGQVDLAGLSMGGGMALWAALHAPERVRRLIPVSAYGLMDKLPLQAVARRLALSDRRMIVFRAAAASPALVRAGLFMAYARPWRAPAGLIAEIREVAADQVRRRTFGRFLDGELGENEPGQGAHGAGGPGPALAGSLTAELPQVTQPTLLIHGTRDPIVPLRHARAAAARIPQARLMTLTSAHWPPREWPDRVAAAMAGFLEPEPRWPAEAAGQAR